MNCRLCLGSDLHLIHDFGNMPIANYLTTSSHRSFLELPLSFFICFSCGLGQTHDLVKPELLFSDYRYLSSASQTFLEHARNFAKDMIKELNFDSSDFVLEIASNDGYLLREFRSMGVRTIGVEPAKNVASIAISNDVYTINEFFGSKLAQHILDEFGYPRLIVANNVLAHVPDIIDFATGLKILTGNRTIVSIENPSILGILTGNQFDSIYHEHFSYLSTFAVNQLCNKVGLKLLNVEFSEVHGGTNRYFLGETGASVSQEIYDFIQFELNQGLLSIEAWASASTRFDLSASAFSDHVLQSKGSIVGFGAAAKASTLINYAKIGHNKIQAIVDSGVEKQGRFMPRYEIPIVSPNAMASFLVDEFIIFPWNIQKEIVSQIDSMGFHDVPKRVFIPEPMRV